VVSLSAIAVLSAVSQSFILRELSCQAGTLHSIGHCVRQRPLSLSALTIQAAEDPAARRERLESLGKAIGEYERKYISKAETDLLLQRAEPHRLAAIRGAKALLAEFRREGAEGSRPRSTGPLVRDLIAAEEAFRNAIDASVLQAEQEAAVRIEGLRSLQVKLFWFVILVLMLEGLCVVNPAVRKIQDYTEDMRRSNEEMKVYAERLERSNKELQDFASVASHDLQEPLRKVQAFSDRLRSKCGAALDDAGRDYLDRIQNAARRMQTLINDLLTYARVTTKGQPFVPVDLAEAAREVRGDLEARIEQVHGQVEIGDLPTVDADPMQVRQLMQNLIGNALKYHRPEAAPVVKVYSLMRDRGGPSTPDEPSGGHCEILVEDNGIGFEEIYKDRIFTIFQRLHNRNEYEGTGVGLAVCRKIAERHRGTITARSTPGQGSTFMVTLPVRQPKETDADGCTESPDCHPDRGR
jgi:signal transduction histidine kinase